MLTTHLLSIEQHIFENVVCKVQIVEIIEEGDFRKTLSKILKGFVDAMICEGLWLFSIIKMTWRCQENF